MNIRQTLSVYSMQKVANHKTENGYPLVRGNEGVEER